MFSNLCFGGGGMKIIPFIGALRFFLKNNIINFKLLKELIGVSAGSFLALLINLGYNIEEIESFILNFNYNFLIPENNSENLIFNYGLEPITKMNNLLKTFFINKQINHKITFLEFFKLTKIKLTIVITNLTKKKVEYWNYLNYPNIMVIDAVKISSCFPLVYQPIKINNCYYIDGGILDNFPIHLTNPETTLGFLTRTKFKKGFNDFLDYFLEILQLLSVTREQSKIDAIKHYSNIILIPNNLNILDFNLSKEQIKEKINFGEKYARKFYYKLLKNKKRRKSI
jgi:predicted acylesterase/phospholipase RssA